MISRPIPSQSSTPFVCDRIDQLQHERQSLQWLAIAPHDEDLIQSLSDALDGKPGAILTRDQDSAFDDEFHRSLQSLCSEQAVDHLIVVGTSTLGSSGPENELDAEEVELGMVEVRERLFTGAAVQNASNRLAQETFVRQVEAFVSTDWIERLRGEGTLSISGLFFRACDGVFLLYDPTTRRMSPLV